ncbi:FCD domain-containing protein, partial [Paracoccaceae bacterium]|nr:FCD domain-containing protein [Paracoccaceae bacterium]
RADFDRLGQLCTKMEASVDNAAAFAEADTEFHRALVECTGNVLLIWIMDQITSVRGQSDWTRMRSLTLNTAIIQQYNAQHRRILNALYSREPEAAASNMKEHLETARLSLTRAAAA